MTLMTRAAPPSSAALTLAALAALAWPGGALGVTPNRAVEALALLDGAGRPGLELAASTWLEGDVEAFASLAWWSARRTTGRAADDTSQAAFQVALEPAVGLRWAADRDGWRPEASAGLGWRWSGGAWRRGALAGALRAGLEWLPARRIGLGLGAGLRWAGTGAPAIEGWAGARLYF